MLLFSVASTKHTRTNHQQTKSIHTSNRPNYVYLISYKILQLKYYYNTRQKHIIFEILLFSYYITMWIFHWITPNHNIFEFDKYPFRFLVCALWVEGHKVWYAHLTALMVILNIIFDIKGWNHKIDLSSYICLFHKILKSRSRLWSH